VLDSRVKIFRIFSRGFMTRGIELYRSGLDRNWSLTALHSFVIMSDTVLD